MENTLPPLNAHAPARRIVESGYFAKMDRVKVALEVIKCYGLPKESETVAFPTWKAAHDTLRAFLEEQPPVAPPDHTP